MTPRTFWAILIKIMGVYTVLESLFAIPQFLITINYFFTSSTSHEGSPVILYMICYLTITICIYVLVIRYAIFKTDWVIDKLKLDTGYEDERLEFNIHRSTLLKIVIMVTGGWLLIDNFPALCNQLLNYFKRRDEYEGAFRPNPASGYIIIYSLKTVIGYFMLTCSRMIINFMEVRRRKSVVVGDEDK
jgi:hypothetical protein